MYIIFCISIKCLIIPLALELTNSGSKCQCPLLLEEHTMQDQNDPHPCVGTLPTHTNAGSKCHLPSVGTLPAHTNGLHFMFKMGYTFVGRHPTLQQGLLEYCLHLATNFLFLFNSENVDTNLLLSRLQISLWLRLCVSSLESHL